MPFIIPKVTSLACGSNGSSSISSKSRRQREVTSGAGTQASIESLLSQAGEILLHQGREYGVSAEHTIDFLSFLLRFLLPNYLVLYPEAKRQEVLHRFLGKTSHRCCDDDESRPSPAAVFISVAEAWATARIGYNGDDGMVVVATPSPLSSSSSLSPFDPVTTSCLLDRVMSFITGNRFEAVVEEMMTSR